MRFFKGLPWLCFFLLPEMSVAGIDFKECHRNSSGQQECSIASNDLQAPLKAVLQDLSVDLGSLTSKIKSIIITDEFNGSAMTVALPAGEFPISGYDIYISKRVLLASNDLSGFLTWKEGRIFGNDLGTGPSQVRAVIPGKQFSNLYYVLLHELGHVAWYEYGADRIECSWPSLASTPYMEAAVFLEKVFLPQHQGKTLKDLKCAFSKQSFKAFSWSTNWPFVSGNRYENRRLKSQDVTELEKICFYGCSSKPTWTQREVRSLYRKLQHQTAFTTVYSAYLKPEEDFAESFAYSYLRKIPGVNYRVSLNTGESFDIFEKVQSSAFRSKRDFIDKLLSQITEFSKQGARSNGL